MRLPTRRPVSPAFIGDLIYNLFGLPSIVGDGKNDFMEVVKLYEKWCGVQVCGIDQ